MRLRSIYFLFAVLLCLAACNQKVENIVLEIPTLRASMIFNSDSVHHFLKTYKDKNKEMADSYFKKGRDMEEANPERAAFCIKRAVTLYPSTDYYLELGAIDYKLNDYDAMFDNDYFIYREAIDTASLLKFDKQAKANVILERIIATILKCKGELVKYDDEVPEADAKEMGISVAELRSRVFSDKRLKFDTTSDLYKNLYLVFLTDSETVLYMKQPATFNYFLSTIKDTSSIFSIDKQQVQQFDYSNYNGRFRFGGAGPEQMYVSDFFDCYLPERAANKTRSIAYNFTHRVKLNDSINVVVYSIDTSWHACPIDMRHVYHRIITYGKNGRIIASLIVAQQEGEALQTMGYNHGRIMYTTYKRTWEKPYDQKDFDNTIVKTEETGTMEYQITSTGEIRKVSAGNNTAL